MNQRQRAFCEQYIKCSNAAEAARAAGYSATTARSQGQRLLTNDDITKYIRQLNEDASAANTAEIGEVRRFWSAIIRDETARPGMRLKASELLAKTT